MNHEQLADFAKRFLAGVLSPEDFASAVAPAASADLGEAQLDLDRRRRCGFPEVVFGQGKSLEALERIVARLVDERIDVLATRVDASSGSALVARFPLGRYNATARALRVPLSDATQCERRGRVAVVTAGTSDRPVAEEACETLDWMGVEWTLIQDIGVAGPHRLRERLPEILPADAVVVVAGMEGALPSVVGGYVACPVVAVPTSVGYGASFGGVAALLGMLNSCAANVTVVNIDAGFKGGYVAGMIARGRA